MLDPFSDGDDNDSNSNSDSDIMGGSIDVARSRNSGCVIDGNSSSSSNNNATVNASENNNGGSRNSETGNASSSNSETGNASNNNNDGSNTRSGPGVSIPVRRRLNPWNVAQQEAAAVRKQGNVLESLLAKNG